MSRSSWLRLGAALTGAACFVGSFLLPPAAAVLAPLGTFGIGYAMRAPGDVSGAELAERGRGAAEAAGVAALAAASGAAAAGKPPAAVAAAAGAAAANAAAGAFVAPR
jgi:hypothetical protein